MARVKDNGDNAEAPSRSAKKRASAALQKLGEDLARLDPEKRKSLGLPPDLEEALLQHDRLTDREACRRQRQFIGRLMREVDAEAIRARLAELSIPTAASIAAQKHAEQQRQALLSVPEEGLEQAIRKLAPAENRAQILLAEVRLARSRPNSPAGKHAFREIFRLLCS